MRQRRVAEGGADDHQRRSDRRAVAEGEHNEQIDAVDLGPFGKQLLDGVQQDAALTLWAALSTSPLAARATPQAASSSGKGTASDRSLSRIRDMGLIVSTRTLRAARHLAPPCRDRSVAHSWPPGHRPAGPGSAGRGDAGTPRAQP